MLYINKLIFQDKHKLKINYNNPMNLIKIYNQKKNKNI